MENVLLFKYSYIFLTILTRLRLETFLSSLKINAPTVCDDLPRKNESYVGTYIKVKTNVKKFTKTDKG